MGPRDKVNWMDWTCKVWWIGWTKQARIEEIQPVGTKNCVEWMGKMVVGEANWARLNGLISWVERDRWVGHASLDQMDNWLGLDRLDQVGVPWAWTWTKLFLYGYLIIMKIISHLLHITFVTSQTIRIQMKHLFYSTKEQSIPF